MEYKDIQYSVRPLSISMSISSGPFRLSGPRGLGCRWFPAVLLPDHGTMAALSPAPHHTNGDTVVVRPFTLDKVTQFTSVGWVTARRFLYAHQML
jgi:hypothetical protein